MPVLGCRGCAISQEQPFGPTWRFVTRPSASITNRLISSSSSLSSISHRYYTYIACVSRLHVTASRRTARRSSSLSAGTTQRPPGSRAGSMSSPTSMSRPYSGYEDLSLSDNEPEPASQSSPTVAHARQDSHPSSISYPNDWTSSSSPPAQSTDPWQSHPLASHTSHQPGPSGPSDPTSPPGTGRTSSLASLSASSSRPVPSPGASVSRTTTTTTATSPSDGTLVLGVAVVDFNHLVCPMFPCPTCADLLQPLVWMAFLLLAPCSTFGLNGSRTRAWANSIQIGPTVEFAYPPTLQLALQDDEALGRLLPFLALPDGAHLVSELPDPFAIHMKS